ncbi:hypothetical protein LCGC14_1125620 [marine sediment metagenome]|uniref:Uncharacterized protein n=1 Tax=marine sediment metagenome TaxID=412755 RepID=A0A0F9M7G0_9ZZZZ
MRFIELPVFTPKALDPVPMFVNPEQVFFVAKADVPSTVIDKGDKVLMKEGTVVSSGGQGALLVDMLMPEVVELFNKEDDLLLYWPLKGEGKNKNEQVKSIKVDTKRVRKSTKIRK